MSTSKVTYFGQAACIAAMDLMGRVNKAIINWDDKYDYTRVSVPEYFDTLNIISHDGVEKKYHYHKFLYGIVKKVNEKEDFNQRINDEGFWKTQWGFEYSPFRIVQKLLKEQGIYMVDHTFKGKTPFIYIYRRLPERNVITNKPWHDNYNIPSLNQNDFKNTKLSNAEINFAVCKTMINFNAIFSYFTKTMQGVSFKLNDFGLKFPVITNNTPVVVNV